MANYARYGEVRMNTTTFDAQHATRADLKELELRLLKWQFGIALALATIMAKGFGWIGF